MQFLYVRFYVAGSFGFYSVLQKETVEEFFYSRVDGNYGKFKEVAMDKRIKKYVVKAYGRCRGIPLNHWDQGRTKSCGDPVFSWP